ncbi:MAG: ComEA family DNA-binding protein [Myxococcaceae bacterium]
MSARGLVLAAAVLSGAWAHAAPVAPGSATAGKAKRSAGSGVLNLNTATLDQIDALPGVSSRLAAAVVAERTARPFSRPEDVMRVRGLSRKRFERLRPHLTVTGTTSFVPATGRPGPRAAKARARHAPGGGAHP